MSELERINFEDVNVGDVVCVPRSVSISWEKFRYSYFVETTVTKVTPKKTKITTDKCGEIKVSDHIPLYKPSEETKRQSIVSTAYKTVGNSIYNLDALCRCGGIRKLDDETLIKVAEKLKEVSEIIKKED